MRISKEANLAVITLNVDHTAVIMELKSPTLTKQMLFGETELLPITSMTTLEDQNW
jgi:hypothetical protein